MCTLNYKILVPMPKLNQSLHRDQQTKPKSLVREPIPIHKKMSIVEEIKKKLKSDVCSSMNRITN